MSASPNPRAKAILGASEGAWELLVMHCEREGGRWPDAAIRFDLAVLCDRAAHPSRPEKRPGYRQLSKRWGVTPKVARRLMVQFDPEGRTEGAARAQQGRSKGAPDTDQPREPKEKGPDEGAPRAHRGRTEGDTRVDLLSPASASLPPTDHEEQQVAGQPDDPQEIDPMTQIGLPGVTQSEDLASPASQVIDHWWEAWQERKRKTGPWPRGRKSNPRGFPRAKPTTCAELDQALKRHSVADLQIVIDWAFLAPGFHPQLLRGDGDGDTVYLGLANLFRSTKLSGKLEKAHAWEDDGRVIWTRPPMAGEYRGPIPEPTPIPEGFTL